MTVNLLAKKGMTMLCGIIDPDSSVEISLLPWGQETQGWNEVETLATLSVPRVLG